jgi:hypothetical protein
LLLASMMSLALRASSGPIWPLKMLFSAPATSSRVVKGSAGSAYARWRYFFTRASKTRSRRHLDQPAPRASE